MPTDKKLPTGADIKRVRKAMRFTQEDLGKYWDYDRVTIGQWERLGDKVLPHAKAMAILIAELETKIVEF